MGGPHRRRMPRSAGYAGLSRGAHRAAATADLGDGGAAAPSRADRQDAGDHRCAVRRPTDRRLRRGLAEGGVRGGRRPGFRRARPGDGRVLEAFKVLWTKDAPAYGGQHVQFDNIMFAPKPVQKPHPPIWIGGESKLAMQRAVRLGNGWYPASNNPQNRLDTASRLVVAVQELRRMAEAAGRDPASLDIAYIALSPVDWTAQKAERRAAAHLHRRRAALAADVATLEQAGVRHVCLTLPDRRARRDAGAHRALRLGCDAPALIRDAGPACSTR